MYKRIIFLFLILSPFIQAQKYYYTDGVKIYIEQKPNLYAVEVSDSITENEIENFLTGNNLVASTKSLNTKYILVKSSSCNKKQLNTLVKSQSWGKGVTTIYTYSNRNYEFTVTDKIVIKLKNESDLNKFLRKYNLKRIEKEWLGDKVYLFQLNTKNEQLTIDIANEIYESGLVEFSHPDFVIFNWSESDTNDEFYQYQWNLNKISAANAWDISTGSPSVIIAVLDAGVKSNHPDLNDHLVTGYDVVDNDNTTDPYGSDYHGTACAGVAAAETNNGIGIAGVGYNCKIMPIQFTHTSSWANTSNFAAGINWAATNGAYIISISGTTIAADVVNNAINSATSIGRNGKGCIIVKSAGNRGEEDQEITFPGKHPKVICVGASDPNDARRNYSSYGPELDVMSPSEVYATNLTSYTSSFGGTSSAAPHVAGLAGLILSVDNSLSEAVLRKIICYTADDINTLGFDNQTGWGRINAWKALDAINHTTTNGTLLGNEVWYGTVNLINGINKYSIISTGGTIVLEGNPTINGLRAFIGASPNYGLFGSIRTACNYSQWGTVQIVSGSFSDDIYIDHPPGFVRIMGDAYGSGSEIWHIFIRNSNYAVWISDLKVNKDIQITNSSQPILEYVILQPYYFSTEALLLAYNSGYSVWGMEIAQSTIWDLPEGIGAYFYNTDVRITSNTILAGFDYASTFLAGSEGLFNYSQFCSNSSYDITTDASSNVAVYNSMFSGDPKVKTNGNVTWIGYTICPSKQNYSLVRNKYKLIDFTEVGFRDSILQYIDSLKNFIINNPSSGLVKKALRKLIKLYKGYDFEEMNLFLQIIIEDRRFKRIKNLAKRYTIDYYNYKKDYERSLLISNEILNSGEQDTLVICETLFEKAMVCESLGDIEEAINTYLQIVTNYVDNPLAIFARKDLERLGIENRVAKKAEETLLNEDNSFSLDNYPNPFNPTTTISYSIPTDEKVIIKIFDILGSEIRTLVNEEKTAGKYSINFDASNLASGIYFYSINAGRFSQTKKMIFTK